MNIILIAPVVLWPLPTIFFDNPMLTDAIIPKWHLSIVILLIASVAMDSMLYSIKNTSQVISATLWLFAASVLSIQSQDSAWFLALLFLAHSFRSGFRLITESNTQLWWLKIAWYRDIFITLFLFISLPLTGMS